MSKVIVVAISALCLAACLVIPLLYFHSRITTETYRSALFAASVGWFVCAAFFGARKRS